MADEPRGPILARVTITRYLSDDDVIDGVVAEAGDGEDLGLAEALGMIELAKFTLVETFTQAADDDDV